MKIKTVYKCTNCGYKSPKWAGKCPDCGEWNTFEEAEEAKNNGKVAKAVSKQPVSRLFEVETGNDQRLLTGITEFDRVMGGGIVRDSVTIITSPPGGGKSTLSLMAAAALAKQGHRVLYASGEESDSQIKNRADRILETIEQNIFILADTSMDRVLEAISEVDPDLIILDSIQTFSLAEFLPSRAGNPTQTMECASALVSVAKNKKRPRAALMIGQMNKSDEIAGLRALEHLVDAVLVLEGEGADELRCLVATKNRFGSTGEMGFFTMTEAGLVSIENPSEYFVTKRQKGEDVSGSALTVLKEGSRPVIAEIESLVSASFTPYPSRISETMKKDTMNTLISILEQRGNVKLYDKNVVIKTTGGLYLKEQAANLAVLMSIASSVYNKPIPSNWAFLADVGLTGELKRVPSMESRVKELDRMGFEKVFVPVGGVRETNLEHMEVVEVKSLSQLLGMFFVKKHI
ncbi:MAG: DNA repair protein RadA [Anaerotignum sp.]|nr:DNA repair protein RadA [Anaerotignum sp.]